MSRSITEPTHPHLEGLIRLRERIRMASVMACGGIPNAEAGGWSDELREIIQALAALPGGGVDGDARPLSASELRDM